MKSILGRSIYASGLHQLVLKNTAVIVAFHRVNTTTVGDGLTCDVDAFERYCRFFANYFNPVSLRHLVEKIHSRAPMNCDLAITFDDGYRDNYEYAAPVLTALKLPATFFVVSEFIGTECVPWWDAALGTRQPWMTWDQLRELHRIGFEIGAHTRTHVNLGGVSSGKAREEILGSRYDLEEKLGARVDLFAYPYGKESDISDESRRVIKDAGFRCCCSCFGGINSSDSDPYNLRRIPVSPWYGSPPHLGFEVALRRA